MTYGDYYNSEDMEEAWKHAFKKLKVNSTQVNGVVIVGRASYSQSTNENIVQSLFESFEVHNCYLANSSVMALYSTGRTNGLVVASGEG